MQNKVSAQKLFLPRFLTRNMTVLSSSQTIGAVGQAPVKLEHVPAGSLEVSKPLWWLESRFHFSFASVYYPDAKRNQFGVLRVINDDLVKGKAGFGTHPHRDAEIFSYVVDGKLSHRDSMGNTEALPRGSIQYLSAGKGISHSEMNEQEETTRFLQVWLNPSVKGATPQYGSNEYAPSDRKNRLLHVLGGNGKDLPSWKTLYSPNAIKLHADANVVVSEADAGVSFETPLDPKRQAYLVCIEGSLTLNDLRLNTRDGVRIYGHDEEKGDLTITAGDRGAHFMLIEMSKR